jgi:hypothetical protein
VEMCPVCEKPYATKCRCDYPTIIETLHRQLNVQTDILVEIENRNARLETIVRRYRRRSDERA